MSIRRVVVVQVTAIVVIGVTLLLASACTAKNKSAEQRGEVVQPLFMDSDTQTYEVISPEEAESILSQPSVPENDSFKPFAENNQKFMDDSSECNKGVEPLKIFINRFTNDSIFQRDRQRLEDSNIYVPLLSSSNLTVSLPDETGFFASWSAVEHNYASFCSGWLDSEMAEELVFQRINDRWYLIDYFDSRTWTE